MKLARYLQGHKVVFLDGTGTVATVLRHQRNGVVVNYWGSGLKAGQSITRRVAARNIRLAGFGD
jgi:hypothetical protein